MLPWEKTPRGADQESGCSDDDGSARKVVCSLQTVHAKAYCIECRSADHDEHYLSALCSMSSPNASYMLILKAMSVCVGCSTAWGCEGQPTHMAHPPKHLIFGDCFSVCLSFSSHSVASVDAPLVIFCGASSHISTCTLHAQQLLLKGVLASCIHDPQSHQKSVQTHWKHVALQSFAAGMHVSQEDALLTYWSKACRHLASIVTTPALCTVTTED